MTEFELARRFQELTGKAPRWVARAPGRVNLMGEHTDYNEGFVLPMAIERDTVIAAAPNDSNRITLRSTAVADIVSIELGRPIEVEPKGRWTNYPKGVLAGFLAAGYAPCGFDALIYSTVPIGAGLSSSAALEVATATLLEAVVGQRLDPVRKALLCQKAEHEYAQVPCGMMDQFIATLGRADHLLLLDCRSHETQWIELADPAVAVMIIKTHVKHELASSEYAVRRRQCEAAAKSLGLASLREAADEALQAAQPRMDPVVFRRARHVLTENARVLKAAAASRARDWVGFGELMYESHESSRQDFEISCAELDQVVRIARDIGPAGGMLGCRMTGGGFGGCTVALIETRAAESIARTMTREYRALYGVEPMVFVSRPAQGTGLLSDAGRAVC